MTRWILLPLLLLVAACSRSVPVQIAADVDDSLARPLLNEFAESQKVDHRSRPRCRCGGVVGERPAGRAPTRRGGRARAAVAGRPGRTEAAARRPGTPLGGGGRDRAGHRLRSRAPAGRHLADPRPRSRAAGVCAPARDGGSDPRHRPVARGSAQRAARRRGRPRVLPLPARQRGAHRRERGRRRHRADRRRTAAGVDRQRSRLRRAGGAAAPGDHDPRSGRRGNGRVRAAVGGRDHAARRRQRAGGRARRVPARPAAGVPHRAHHQRVRHLRRRQGAAEPVERQTG